MIFNNVYDKKIKEIFKKSSLDGIKLLAKKDFSDFDFDFDKFTKDDCQFMISATEEHKDYNSIVKNVFLVAAEKGYVEIVAQATHFGVSVNMRDGNNDTLLTLATSNNHKEVVDSLIGQGASVDLKNNDQKTALMLASALGHKEIANNLIEAGAAVNEKSYSSTFGPNDELITALSLAKANGHAELVDMLEKSGAIKQNRVRLKDVVQEETQIKIATNPNLSLIDKARDFLSGDKPIQTSGSKPS